MKIEGSFINPIPYEYEITNFNSNKSKPKENFSVVLENTMKKHNLNNLTPIQKEMTTYKFDVRNASLFEFEAIVFKLYETGQMSFQESGVAVFDPTFCPEIEGKWWLTLLNSEGKRDWIAEWEARAKKSASSKEIGFEIDQRIVDVLKKLPPGGIEIEERIIDRLKQFSPSAKEHYKLEENNENKETFSLKRGGFFFSFLSSYFPFIFKIITQETSILSTYIQQQNL